MKGDFSRLGFRPEKHFAGVLHQQGRVWLDSDWNEEVLTRLHRQELEAIDVIGRCGVPAEDAGFKIDLEPEQPLNFRIGKGRCYVHGLLCQLDEEVTYDLQPDLPAPPEISIPDGSNPVTALVYLEAWQRLITHVEDEEIREVALGGPDTAVRLRTVAQVKVKLLENDASCESAQDLLPKKSHGTLTTVQPTDTLPPDGCRLPDPSLYAGRENRLYRVEIHDGGDVLDAANAGTFLIKLAESVSTGAGQIRLSQGLSRIQEDAINRSGIVRIVDVDGREETLSVSEVAKANGRAVLKLRGGPTWEYSEEATVVGGVARFKWSRDNAAFAVHATPADQNRSISTNLLILSSLGRDQATALRAGDLVEISDETSELRDGRGHLTHLASRGSPG
jgi:hypothetical protein